MGRVRGIEQRKLGVVIPHIDLPEVDGAPVVALAARLGFLFHLLALLLVPISKEDVCSEAMQQADGGSSDALSTAYMGPSGFSEKHMGMNAGRGRPLTCKDDDLALQCLRIGL